MALNFVAAEDGLEDGPKLLALARELKVSRAEAVFYVLRLRRLVLHEGNHLTGALAKNYTAADLAAFLECRCKPSRLVEVLKRACFLGWRKGRGFFYPDWKHTITGQYAHERESDRLWHAQKRKENRDGRQTSPDVARPSDDASADSRPTSNRILEEGRKEGENRPPGPPRPGGASERASARWEWLAEHAPSPQNRSVCEAILRVMPDEEWALVQRAYDATLRTGPPIALSRKTLATLDWGTDRFLRQQAYFRFRARSKPAKNGQPKPIDAAADLLARQQASDRYVTELLADPAASAAQRETARRAWLASPVNGGRQPPWETSPDPPPVLEELSAN
jgi:hypothetical protein